MKLKGKVAVITGGSRGIGFAVAKKFLQEGAKVAIVGSRTETTSAAVRHIQEKDPNAQVIGVAANMNSTEEIQSLFRTIVEKWGYVDILVNNAGISFTKPIDQMTDEEWFNVMSVNVSGVFRCMREAVKIMKKKGGSIINTSSMVSRNGSPHQCAYTASKFAVNGLTRSCARELGQFNIRVNAVAPGVTMTEMAATHVTEQMMEGLKRATPLGRVGQPEDLVGAYVYLASDDARFTTGALIHVDGGIII